MALALSSRKVSARPTSRTSSRVRCTRMRRRAARSLKRREHTRTNEAVVRLVRLRALILPPCLLLLFCCPQATTDASTSAPVRARARMSESERDRAQETLSKTRGEHRSLPRHLPRSIQRPPPLRPRPRPNPAVSHHAARQLRRSATAAPPARRTPHDQRSARAGVFLSNRYAGTLGSFKREHLLVHL
jgi:hypothetical protein